MSALAGVHVYRNPRTGRSERATIAAPIIRAYDYATRSGKDGYRCLGVVGNQHHLTAAYPGDHTWYSTHSTIVKPGGATVLPRHGVIYAGDFEVPDMARFEKWLLARLRAGVYVNDVKYFNILYRHWNRKAIKSGKMFAYSVYSGDHHLHLSIMPGAELSALDIFADYEHYRSTGKNVARPAARKPAAKPGTPKGGVTPLPMLRRNSRKASSANKTLQRALIKLGHPVGKAGADGWFGSATDKAVKAFQRKNGLTGDGIVGAKTWTALVQALLEKAGPKSGLRINGAWSASATNQVIAFQKARKLTADGIVGPVTLAALLK